ncbi:MAG TPA: serine--tRNA ligase, partial [Parvularcula sp.]|nr:serine--tRNA ligase [Parvularcula sp.]
MHDIQFIRENPDAFDRGLARRGLSRRAADILALDEKARALTSRLQDLQTRRNAASKAIGAAKAKKDEAEAARLMAEVEAVKQEMPRLEAEEAAAKKARDDLLAALPNLPAPDVPDGKDEHGNVEARKWGEPKRINNAREHFDLGEALGLMDFETAAKMSGARFVILSGALARMERAIANLMLDTHTAEFGYTEVSPPALVRDIAPFGVGQLPKFEEDLFQTTNGYWLTSTAEVTLSNILADAIVDDDTLPRRYTAWTPCFRSEAGAAGKDTRGMIR